MKKITLKHLLYLAAMVLVGTVALVCCSDDEDDNQENKNTLFSTYSFQDLNIMRKMSSDKLIAKLQKDGWDKKDHLVSGSGYEFYKTISNDLRYSLYCDPTEEYISFSIRKADKELDEHLIKSIIADEEIFAGSNPIKIRIYNKNDDDYYFTDREEAVKSFLDMLIEHEEAFIDFTHNDYKTFIECDYNGTGSYYSYKITKKF